MAGIHDIGNGFGYVYMTETDGSTISSVVANTNEGVRCFKENGNIVAPLAANRSAFGLLTFTTGVAGAGSITAVSVNGVDQIAAPLLVTGFTDAQCATVVANAINAFTPGSGYDYTAVAVGGSVYIFAPPSAGSTPNGYAILVSDTGAVVTYNADSFKNGSNDNGAYDSISGSRFFLNADYGPNGISGELTADPTNLVNAVEITKYFIMRGQQVGIFSKDVTASSNTLYGIDRSGMMTKVNVIPAVGTTETVIKLSAEDFIEGDIVFLAAQDSAHTITVESAPAITVPGTGNIYLTDDLPWISNRYTSLMLLFKYITGIGPCFVEMARSLATPDDTMIGATLYVSSAGDDTTAVRGNIKRHYATITAAKNAASSGDVIVVFPGTYNEEELQKNGVNYFFMPGATVSHTNIIFNITNQEMTVEGSGVFISTNQTPVVTGFNASPAITFHLRCKQLEGAGGGLFHGGNVNLDVEVEADIVGYAGTSVWIEGAGSSVGISTRIVANDLRSTLSSSNPGMYNALVPFYANLYITDYWGILYLKCRRMSQAGREASNIYYNYSGDLSAGTPEKRIYIECEKIINYQATTQVQAVVINSSAYLTLVADIYCVGAGNISDALCIYTSGQSYQIGFYGNIYTEGGIAVLVYGGTGAANYAASGGSILNIEGDIFSKTTNMPATAISFAPALPAPAAVCIGGNTASGTNPVGSVVRFRKGSVNQFTAGSYCIYKAMQPTGAAEDNNQLELGPVKLYSDDGVTNTIYAEAPAGVPVNMAVVMGAYANVAAHVNLTIEGALTVNANVTSEYPWG